MSRVNKDTPIEGVTFDHSEEVPAIWLNAIEINFQNEYDARQVFDILNAARDKIQNLNKALRHAEGLTRTTLHFLENL